jgi:hypothetical protein
LELELELLELDLELDEFESESESESEDLSESVPYEKVGFFIELRSTPPGRAPPFPGRAFPC